MSIKIEGGGSKENIIKSGTSNELLCNGEEIFLKKDLLDFVHPVGSIYWSSNDTDPAILFGGTWVRIKDKFLWAIGDSDTLNSTGGEKTHTLTKDEMPSHGHEFSGSASHNHDVIFSSAPGVDFVYYFGGQYNGFVGNSVSYDEGREHNNATGSIITNSRTVTISGTTGSRGSGTAHNNMPPYIVKYCWERTA